MASLASAAQSDIADLTEWRCPLLGPRGLQPPFASEVPSGLTLSKDGFVQRHADRRKDALAALKNVGPMTRGDFAILGISGLGDLASADGSELYIRLQRLTGLSIDPCQHDVMLATVAEARGDHPKKWWAFTPERKAMPDLRLPKTLVGGH
ncbi:MAG: helix-hairpin-helix domain-containing protein [Pseudomonadota bacterium]